MNFVRVASAQVIKTLVAVIGMKREASIRRCCLNCQAAVDGEPEFRSSSEGRVLPSNDDGCVTSDPVAFYTFAAAFGMVGDFSASLYSQLLHLWVPGCWCPVFISICFPLVAFLQSFLFQ